MAVVKRFRILKSSKRKIVFYEAQVYVQGVRVSLKTFPTRATAEVWHDATKAGWIDGKPPIDTSPKKVEPSVTFGMIVGRYVAEGMDQLKQSSKQTRLIRLPYFQNTPFDSVAMSSFNDVTVDDWISWLRQHPSRNNPGRKSFLHELKYLTVILNWYRNYVNPNFKVPIVKRHRERIFFKPIVSRRPDYFMKPEEIVAWIDWLRERRSNPVYWHLASFLVLTGVRVGEACGLSWNDVDLDSRVVRISKTVTWDHWTRQPTLVDSPKTKESVRVIPLASELVVLLRLMHTSSGGVGPIFQANGGLMRYNAIQSAFNKGFIALDYPWRSTHICRHTNATMMLLATGSMSAVQANLGHASQRESERYAKAVAALQTADADKTAAMIHFSLSKKSQPKSQIEESSHFN